MTDYDFDIGIIGGGAAGLTVASGAAQLGARTLLIEKEKMLGGDCLHYGCVPSKTLIRTAQVYHMMKNGSVRIKDVISVIQKHDSEERFCDLGVRVGFGDVSFTDEHSIRLDGAGYSAKNWVIATGSSPAIPPVEGLERSGYITNKEIFYLDSLPRSIIVLGAGPIAMEMAQAFCRLGSEVTVIQRSGQILSKEDKDMADGVMDAMSSEGVVFHLNTIVVRTEDNGHEKVVVVKDSKSEEIVLKAEKILVAMGRSPNLNGLGLELAGVEFNRRGVLVDNRMRTSQKHIYAAGDITGAYQFTHAAGYEGGIVIGNAIFHLPRKTDYTFFPWCTYTDPELASIGMNEKRAKEAGIEYSVWTEEFKDNDRSLAEGEIKGKIKMLLDEKENPFGVQILGPQAGELVSEWVAVLNGKVKLSTLASAVHPYPTLGEINKRVAGSYLSRNGLFARSLRYAQNFILGISTICLR